MNKKREKHPFYCHVKRCRKSAYDTPEYMTPGDWEFARRAVYLLRAGDKDGLWELLRSPENRELVYGFFNRAIGWPEGLSYCRNLSYFTATAFRGLVKHELPKLEKALSEHDPRICINHEQERNTKK